MRFQHYLGTAAAAILVCTSCVATRAADAGGPPIDVSLVTPRDFVAIVIHPRGIVSSPLVAELLKDEIFAEAIKKVGVGPGEVEQIVVLGRVTVKKPLEPVFFGSVRFSHAVNAKEILSKLRPATDLPIEEVNVGGKACLKFARFGPLAYVPERNTIVLAAEETMHSIVSAAEPKGPLLERLKKADAGQDVIVAIAPEAFPDLDNFIDMAKRGAPPAAMIYLDAARTIRGGTATLNLNGPTLLHLSLETEDAEAAGKVKDLLE